MSTNELITVLTVVGGAVSFLWGAFFAWRKWTADHHDRGYSEMHDRVTALLDRYDEQRAESNRLIAEAMKRADTRIAELQEKHATVVHKLEEKMQQCERDCAARDREISDLKLAKQKFEILHQQNRDRIQDLERQLDAGS